MLNSQAARTRFLGLTGNSKIQAAFGWQFMLISHPSKSLTNVCIAIVISQITGKIEKGAKNEGADREQGEKEECKPHSKE